MKNDIVYKITHRHDTWKHIRHIGEPGSTPNPFFGIFCRAFNASDWRYGDEPDPAPGNSAYVVLCDEHGNVLEYKGGDREDCVACIVTEQANENFDIWNNLFPSSYAAFAWEYEIPWGIEVAESMLDNRKGEYSRISLEVSQEILVPTRPENCP